MKLSSMEKKLAGMLSEKRFGHSQRVGQTAAILAAKFGADQKKAELAGLLHDCARAFDQQELFKLSETFAVPINTIEKLQPILLHAPVGKQIARTTFKIDDPEILEAIGRHTVGGTGMSVLDKIIFLADFIEPGRNCPNAVQLRELLMNAETGSLATLDKVMLRAYDSSINYTLGKNELLHLAAIEGRNEILAGLAEGYS